MSFPGTSPPAAPGWYPDPQGGPSFRYWDGTRWTEALSSAIPPASDAASDTTTWAMAAHLTAFAALLVGLPFIGPLLVYATKRDDPFVRRHAVEALNFNLSVMLYVGVVASATLVLLLAWVGGEILMPLLIAIFAGWVIFVILATVAASRGEEYRYPLTIRFVS